MGTGIRHEPRTRMRMTIGGRYQTPILAKPYCRSFGRSKDDPNVAVLVPDKELSDMAKMSQYRICSNPRTRLWKGWGGSKVDRQLALKWAMTLSALTTAHPFQRHTTLAVCKGGISYQVAVDEA